MKMKGVDCGQKQWIKDEGSGLKMKEGSGMKMKGVE